MSMSDSSPQPVPGGADGRGGGIDRSRALALGVIAAGALMNILDGSIVTVALPSIQTDLHFSPPA